MTFSANNVYILCLIEPYAIVFPIRETSPNAKLSLFKTKTFLISSSTPTAYLKRLIPLSSAR